MTCIYFAFEVRSDYGHNWSDSESGNGPILGRFKYDQFNDWSDFDVTQYLDSAIWSKRISCHWAESKYLPEGWKRSPSIYLKVGRGINQSSSRLEEESVSSCGLEVESAMLVWSLEKVLSLTLNLHILTVVHFVGINALNKCLHYLWSPYPISPMSLIRPNIYFK